MMIPWQGWLYVAAVLIPLLAFAVQLLLLGRSKALGAWIASGAIGLSFALSSVGFVAYLVASGGIPEAHHGGGG